MFASMSPLAHSVGERSLPPNERQRPERLSRAALVAFGLGTLAATACGEVNTTNVGEDSGRDATHPVDAPSAVDSFVANHNDAVESHDTGADRNVTVPYGLPPPFDAGEPEDASFPFDVTSQPPYGLPPH
jgi:hypothetical protein